MEVSVIILCGGKGSRIQPVLGSLPKVLAPIGEKAFINYLLAWINSGLKAISHEIILSTCIAHAAIENYVISNSLNCKLSKEDQPLGTFGAVIDVVQKNGLKNDVLVVNGDTIFDCDFLDVYANYKLNSSSPLLIVKPSSAKGRYGGYRRNKNGEIRFCKTDPEFISLGAFFCNALDLLGFNNKLPSDPSKGKMLDQDFLDHSDINIYTLPSDADFIDIGVPIDYQLAQRFIPKIFQS